MSEEGTEAPTETTTDWKSVIPEEYRDVDLVRDSPDVNTFMKRVKDQREFTSNAVRLPSENAGDEERAAQRDKILKHFEKDVMLRPDFENPEQSKMFYQTMGMPEEASGYKMPEVEGVSMAEDREAAFRSIAHDVGLTDKQFNVLMQKGLELDVVGLEANQALMNEGQAGLKADWGAAYPERTELAKKFVAENLPSLDAENIPPNAMKELWNVAKLAYSGGSQMGNGNGDSGIRSPDEAKQQLGELSRNAEFQAALRDTFNPGHKAAKAKKTQLYKEASTGPNGEEIEFSLYG